MNEKAKIWMNNAMHSVMLSCDKATFFVTKKEYVKLSCKENLQLKMHLMGCKLCRSFNEQNTRNTVEQNPFICTVISQSQAIMLMARGNSQ